MHAQSFQSCLTLFDAMDHSPPGFSVLGILQARILEWFAMPTSRGSSGPGDRTGVCLCLLRGRQILYSLKSPGKPQMFVLHGPYSNYLWFVSPDWTLMDTLFNKW